MKRSPSFGLTARAIVLGATMLAPGGSQIARAASSDGPAKIGVLTDIASSNGDNAGMGSVEAARMAIEDFHGVVSGKPVELVFADHQGKPDIGAGIARDWLDNKGITAIVDVPQSAVALAVMPLAERANAALLLSGAGHSAITGKSCAPNTLQWTFSTYALAHSTGQALVADGEKTWSFVSSDYTFGKHLERQVTEAILPLGARALGSVHAPFNTTDFSSYLLQAQASGAQVVAFANVAADTVTSIKQAHEFGLTTAGQKLAGLLVDVTDVRAIGLPSAQGLYATTSFYWDRTDATREWSARFMQRIGRKPTMLQAGVYSAVHHYLTAVQASSTVAGDRVVARMKAMPVDDMFALHGIVREDGQMCMTCIWFESRNHRRSRPTGTCSTSSERSLASRRFNPSRQANVHGLGRLEGAARMYADVIIVGAGPSGLTVAMELAAAGVKVLLLERRTSPVESRAGTILPRS